MYALNIDFKIKRERSHRGYALFKNKEENEILRD